MNPELTLASCPGRYDFSSYCKTNWYGDFNIPISKDTRCEYCKKHMEAFGNDGWYEILPRAEKITCDSIDDPFLTMMEAAGFRIQVTDPTGKIPFLVHPAYSFRRQNGELVVEMPPKAYYSVNINPQQNNRTVSIFYSVEMHVDDTQVMLQETPTLYTDSVTVQGFNEHNPFMFIADDPSIENIECLPENRIKIKIAAYTKNHDNYIKIFDFTVWVQLAYINTELYQSPNHHKMFTELTEEARDYYHVIAQKRRREEATKLGLL